MLTILSLGSEWNLHLGNDRGSVASTPSESRFFRVMMPDLKYPTSVSLSPAVRKKLKAYGEPRGWSMSRMIEWIVASWLQHQAERDEAEKERGGKKGTLTRIK